VAHEAGAARILLSAVPDGVRVEPVVAKTITVAAALAESRRPQSP